jgi:hypothetical protein
MRQHTSAYVSIRSGYVGIRRRTSAYVSIRQHTVRIRRHTSAYVSIRQHTSAYVSIRQHTSAYVKNCLPVVSEAHLTDVTRGVVSGQRHTKTSLPNAEGRDVHVIECGAVDVWRSVSRAVHARPCHHLLLLPVCGLYRPRKEPLEAPWLLSIGIERSHGD